MQPAPRSAVARLTSPGEIAAALPHLCGFVPGESLVVLSLRGPRKRVGVTMRFDLGGCGPAEAVAHDVVARLRQDQASTAILVVFTEEGGALPCSALIAAVSAGCVESGIAVHEAILVRAGHWFSYDCQDTRCCPPEGTPVPTSSGSPGLGLLAAESVLDGRVVRGSRAELAASVGGPTLLAARAAEQAQQQAFARRIARLAAVGEQAERSAAGARWERALAQAGDSPVVLTPAEAAELVVSLLDIGVRDDVLVRIADHSEQMLSLLLWLTGTTVPPEDVPLCTLLAVTAWVRGDGALANIALERVWGTDPNYSLARLVRIGLDQAIPPRQVKRWLRSSAAGRIGPRLSR